MSMNRWGYVRANPINAIDPSGHREPCFAGWGKLAVKWRVDEAEKYVSPTSDPIDTYTAAGIAIQCAGSDNPFNPNSGVGPAQISQNQAETESGEPIYEYNIWGKQQYEKEDGNIKLDKNGNPIPIIRGYGLRLRCLDGELEKVLDPNNSKNAAILMKRRIQLVTDECNGCTSTDIYIAAGLAQNGPGFTHKNMRNGVAIIKPKVICSVCISRDWKRWFEQGQPKNNQDQLWRFNLVINELISRGWSVPFDLDMTTIEDLPNVKVIK